MPAIVALALILCLPAGRSVAEQGRSIGETYAGERLDYEIGFWLFDGVAVGRVELGRDAEGYVAVFSAHTTGIAEWLRHREDTYTARLVEADGGTRFRTVSFDKDVTVGRKKRRTLTEVDYDAGVMRWTEWKDGKLRKTGELELPEGVRYDDPLAAFFNFRYGAYGPIREGESYLIKDAAQGRRARGGHNAEAGNGR